MMLMSIVRRFTVPQDWIAFRYEPIMDIRLGLSTQVGKLSLREEQESVARSRVPTGSAI